MDNTKEEEKNGAPDEACCCDHAAADAAPVTVEMIEEAFERLRNMVNECQTPVLLHMLIDKGDSVSGKNATCDAVTKMPGTKGMAWLAARGYLVASGTCFSGDIEAISQGVRLIFERVNRKAGMNTIASMLGMRRLKHLQ